MYDDEGYANQRLASTIVMHDKLPVYVHFIELIGGELIAKVSEFCGEDKVKYSVRLNELNLSPPKLGWCLTKHGICYLQRKAMRNDWRQGLRRGNFESSWGLDERFVENSELATTLKGIYPHIEYAIEESYNKQSIIPISHDFAIGKKLGENFKLYYKALGEVGDIVNDRFGLFAPFQFLKECLEEVTKDAGA